MTATACMIEALDRANRMSRADRAEAARLWPSTWPEPSVVAYELAKMCADARERQSKGYVRARTMPARPAKPMPPAVDAPREPR